ncbi:MAG: hypothetical protein OHK0022_17810 [Roseiflexaceae bacterium]
MNNNLAQSFFYAIDGDDVGPLIRSKIISNNIQGAAILSQDINHYFTSLSDSLKLKGHQIVFCGGDSLLSISSHLLDFNPSEIPRGPCTISVGIGATAEYAYLALQLAKARGKKQIVHIHDPQADTIFKWND